MRIAARVGERFDIFDVNSLEVDEWFRLRVATVNVRLADVNVPSLGEVVKIGDKAVETFGRVASVGLELLENALEFTGADCSRMRNNATVDGGASTSSESCLMFENGDFVQKEGVDFPRN
jgi:hypothetical protein